jgi:hypothetical protein
MMRRSRLTQRPDSFTLDRDNSLYTGLVFAGLGCHPNSKEFFDSCGDQNYGAGNHGTLTNMAIPATATSGWQWNNYLRRNVLRFNGVDNYIALNAGQLPNHTSAAWSMSLWVKLNYVTYEGLFITDGQGLSVYSSNTWALSAGSVGALRRYSAPAPAVDIWSHLLGTWNGSTKLLFINGVVGTEHATDNMAVDGTYNIGRSSYPSYTNGIISDPITWNRVLSTSEIAQLADPSNFMLSGMLLPPRRRSFATAVAAATSSRRRRLLCGV